MQLALSGSHRMATPNEPPRPWRGGSLIRGSGIPAPSGQYTVGCTPLMHKFEDDTDTLLVTLFYPCQQQGGHYQYALWIPHKRYIKGYMDFLKFKLTGLVSGIMGLVSGGQRVPALFCAPFLTGKQAVSGEENASQIGETDSEVATEAASPEATPTSTSQLVFPVLVFCHGLGSMSMTYSGICCDLASHGYVVASVEHRDRSACVARLRVPKPGGREGELVDEWLIHRHLVEGEKEFPVRHEQVLKRSSDARRALDLLGLLNDGAPVGNLLEATFDFAQFKGRLDLSSAGIVGHSFGGATVIQTLSEDQRFKCGVCLDTWMIPIHKELYENGSVVQQPLIFINSFKFQWKENIQKMTKLTKPPNDQGISTARILTLRGTIHYSQTDVLFVTPSWISRPTLDPTVAHRVNMDICHTFLKRHLLLDPAYQGPIPNLDGCEGHSEYILFGSNVDISESEEAGQGDHVTQTAETRPDDSTRETDKEAKAVASVSEDNTVEQDSQVASNL